MLRILKKIVQVSLPFALGIVILWWMYRGEDWSTVWQYASQRMDWSWMGVSLVFGLLAQQMRAWRWLQTLAPAGERARRRVAEDAVFLSYASSLLVPRVGEVMRCGVLSKYDGVSFPKALGTVVTERAVDCVVILLLTLGALLLQVTDFFAFLHRTGTSLGAALSRFTAPGYLVTAACLLAALLLFALLARRFSIFSRGRDALRGLRDGIVSLRGVQSVPLYIFFSLGIWACYFLHFYTAFFCFDFTSGIGVDEAFLTFCIGTFAVLVPTPNGAGPWHFAVKTMLVLYGVGETDAVMFVFIVHAVQTFEVVVLGVLGWLDLSLRRRRPVVAAAETADNDSQDRHTI